MSPDPRCREAHAKILFGTCPWCQHAVLRGQPVAPRPEARPTFVRRANRQELKQLIRDKLVEKLDMPKLRDLDSKTLRRELRVVIERVCAAVNPFQPRDEQARIIDEILGEMFPAKPKESE